MGTDSDGAMRTMADGLGGQARPVRHPRGDRVFLAGPAAAWMTGSDVVIDGGLSKTV